MSKDRIYQNLDNDEELTDHERREYFDSEMDESESRERWEEDYR